MANTELLEALKMLEKEKNISRSSMIEAIENALLIACKNNFVNSDNMSVTMDPETCVITPNTIPQKR